MRLYLLLVLPLLFLSCEEKISTPKEPILIFSEDYTHVSVFLPTVKFQTTKAESLHNQGITFVKKENFEKAEEKFLAALAIEPEHPGILSDLGNISSKKYNYERALDYYEKAFRNSNFTYYRALYSKGITYILQDDLQQGIDILKEVLQYPIHPIEKASCNYFLTQAYAAIGNCEKSLEAAKNFQEFTSYNQDYRIQQAFLFERANACNFEAYNASFRGELKQDFKFISEEVEYKISSHTYNIKNPEKKDSVRISDIELFDSNPLSTKRIVKSDFENFLYREFYTESELVHTRILDFRNKKIYFSSELINNNSDNSAQIIYFIPLNNKRMDGIQLEEVFYKKPHLNNINSNDAITP